MMQILFPFCGVACVSFPVGKPPWGTCEFANKRCLKECGAFKNATPETTVGYKPKRKAFEFITEKPLFTICAKMLEELKGMKSKILYWFGSGDCMRVYGKRISDIMEHLSLEGIVQCGFTRNKKLWERTQKIGNVRLALTVEIKKVSEIKSSGLIAVPNFASGEVALFWNGVSYGYCGSTRYTLNEIKYEANCQLCYGNKRGCFTN